MKLRFAFACAALATSMACRSDDKNNGNNSNNNNNNGNPAQCPGETLNVCSLKVSSASLHPNPDDPVSLTGVIVTTQTVAVSANLAGFYVVDPAVFETLGGRYSGIAVVYSPMTLAGAVPPPGSVVNIEGSYAEFPVEAAVKQKQVSALRVEATGQGPVCPPSASTEDRRRIPTCAVDIESADRIATGGTEASAYEGSLVTVREVSISETTVKIGDKELFGAFRVDSSLIVDDELYKYVNPVVGEQFTSITGILQIGTSPFDSGEYQLTPRAAGDVIPKNQATVVTSIKDIQDASSPGHPAEMCSNSTGSETVGKCARARLTRVLVTASEGYVSTNLRSIYVQDPAVSDGRFAGIKVVYNPNQVTPPEVGQLVDVEGEIILYRSGMQIQYPTVVRNGTDTQVPTAVTVDANAVARRTDPETQPYEAVLVKIENVSVETACITDDRDRDHGNWIVTGNVMIGTSWDYDYNGDIRPQEIECFDAEGEPTGLCGCTAATPPRPNDQRHAGDTFSSITGVLDYAFGDFQLNPRGNDDLVRAN
ncbi:MAG: hypothetical protein HYV07_32355 [Deltaproteobacteria bacterium]|nr:hypothetical protein [Deltaproteobacteria bacterium]